MHASILATLYNAHFQNDGIPFTPEQVLGKESRAEAVKEARNQRLRTLRFSHMVTSQQKDILPEAVLELEANRKAERERLKNGG